MGQSETILLNPPLPDNSAAAIKHPVMPLNIPNLKPLAKGMLSFAVPKLGTVHGYGNPLGTLAADSCYSIFLRHVCLLRSARVVDLPKTVAELGPGSSHGVGFAALIAGAERYYALDLIDFSNAAQNLSVFDEIAAMFRERRPIPSSGLHSLRFPDLDDYSFPGFLAIGAADEFESRVAEIRQDIASGSGRFVKVAAPWMEKAVIETNSIEWVFSQSVLEHIDDLERTYATLFKWLKPAGYMSHLIDFYSHGLTKEWNGHWALSDLAWRGLKGRRPYLINRQPLQEHMRLWRENSFVTLLEKRNKRFDGLIPADFAPRFQAISDEDARVRMVFLVGRKGGA
jgi:hypothetical protein